MGRSTSRTGDAAHAMFPNTGQGANSALLDAAVLAIELAGDVGADGIAPALAAYDRRRRPKVAVVQDDARRLVRLAHLTRGPARRVRDLAVRAAGRLPSERQARRLYQEDPGAVRAALRSL